MSKENTNWGKAIFILLLLIFIPIPIILIIGALLGIYGVIILICAILIVICNSIIANKKKKHNSLNKAEDLDLKNKNLLELEEMLNEQQNNYANMEYIIVKRLTEDGTYMKDEKRIPILMKIEREKIDPVIYAIRMEIKNRNKINKINKRRGKDNIFKNIIYSVIASILLFISSFILVAMTFEIAYRNKIDTIDIQGILISLPFLIIFFGYPVQRIIRFKKFAFKSNKNFKKNKKDSVIV